VLFYLAQKSHEFHAHCQSGRPSNDMLCNGLTLNVCWKVKSLCLTMHHALKTWGSGGIALCLLDPSTGWRQVVQLNVLATLPMGKEPSVPIGQEFGWGPRAGLDMEKGKIPCPFWELNRSNPAYSIVTILTELSHLHKHVLC
jgi:hypothetical protein